MHCSGNCGMWMGLWCVGWWLLASALLWQTWNRVIAHVTKAKAVKFWQALLFTFTICVLVAPRAYMRARHGHGCEHGECARSLEHDKSSKSEK